MTINNRYPLPRIDGLFNQLKGATIFSNIDVRSGYQQVRIREYDIYKTRFHTRYQHYEFVMAPFGLTNSLATFMCLMNNVLCPYLEIFLILFVYDILVYSKNEEEHEEHLKMVLILLRDHQLYEKLRNNGLFQYSIHNLGHVVFKEWIVVDP